MEKIECSVWSNGGDGWGLRILGGLTVTERHFRPDHSPVYLELDGTSFPVNIAKDSFWKQTCGEMICVPLRDWIKKHGLRTADRVWLEVIEQDHLFRATSRMDTSNSQAAEFTPLEVRGEPISESMLRDRGQN
jgi:hypothetical protein